MLRIGFVGSGLIAWAHGLGLKAMIDGGVVDASIVAVHDQRERRARGFADALGGDDVEVVADAAEVARALRCGLGLHADLGAPGARWTRRSPPGGRVLREAARSWTWPRAPVAGRGRRVPPASASQCGLVLRSAPVFRALRDLVQGGTLGAPMAAVFRDDQYFPIQGQYASQWRADVAQAGGGCLIEHSIHDLDILRFCFGEVDSVVGPDGEPRRATKGSRIWRPSRCPSPRDSRRS